MKFTLFIEGGGEVRRQHALFRSGWASFFGKAGLAGRRMPTVEAGGARSTTFELFKHAIRTRKPGEIPLLLVDSEDLVPLEDRPSWEHLRTRREDRWDKPEGAGDDDAYLMICCMETWLVADRKTLKDFFGQNWRDKALPEWPAPEKISKQQVWDALKKATAGCARKHYAKGKVSFELLGKIDPAEVEKRCPAARRLLERLQLA